MKKILCVLLCVLMLLPLIACNDESYDAPQDGTTVENTVADQADAPKQMIDIIKDGVTSYEIIYPEKSNAQEANFINNFSAMFAEKTGVKLSAKDDFLKFGESHDTDTCKIFIGKTNRG